MRSKPPMCFASYFSLSATARRRQASSSSDVFGGRGAHSAPPPAAAPAAAGDVSPTPLSPARCFAARVSMRRPAAARRSCFFVFAMSAGSTLTCRADPGKGLMNELGGPAQSPSAFNARSQRAPGLGREKPALSG
eukprot:356659-Chlamydomonas_euryale.AAC.2